MHDLDGLLRKNWQGVPTVRARLSDLNFQTTQVRTGFSQFYPIDYLLQSQIFHQLYSGYPIAFVKIAQSNAE